MILLLRLTKVNGCLSGMSHEEAAEDLVMNRKKIISRVKEFYTYMVG